MHKWLVSYKHTRLNGYEIYYTNIDRVMIEDCDNEEVTEDFIKQLEKRIQKDIYDSNKGVPNMIPEYIGNHRVEVLSLTKVIK